MHCHSMIVDLVDLYSTVCTVLRTILCPRTPAVYRHFRTDRLNDAYEAVCAKDGQGHPTRGWIC